VVGDKQEHWIGGGEKGTGEKGTHLFLGVKGDGGIIRTSKRGRRDYKE
jgi:hypothetical protein